MSPLTAAQRPYRPSCGAEGMDFRHNFCRRCKHDANHDCNILLRALVHDTDEPEYPTEWVQDASDVTGETARCTAFTEAP